MEKIARGHGRETNIAQGEAKCYLGSRISLSAIFSTLHSRQCFIVLAGLFEQIAKVLLGAIERQSTRKVRNLALADHSKAVYLC